MARRRTRVEQAMERAHNPFAIDHVQPQPTLQGGYSLTVTLEAEGVHIDNHRDSLFLNSQGQVERHIGVTDNETFVNVLPRDGLI